MVPALGAARTRKFAAGAESAERSAHGLVATPTTGVAGRRTLGISGTPLGGLLARRTVPIFYRQRATRRLEPVEFRSIDARVSTRRGRRRAGRPRPTAVERVERFERAGLAQYELFLRSRSFRGGVFGHHRARTVARPRGQPPHGDADLLRRQHHPRYRNPTPRSQSGRHDGARHSQIDRVHQRQMGHAQNPGRGGHPPGLRQPGRYEPIPRRRRQVEPHARRGHRKDRRHHPHRRAGRLRAAGEILRRCPHRQLADRLGRLRVECEYPRGTLRHRGRRSLARRVVAVHQRRRGRRLDTRR